MAKKILVCDDSKTIQHAVQIALLQSGVEIATVSEAGQVVSSAQAEAPDLILLDNRMNTGGQDDGYELCTALKQNAATAHIPVLFLAGRSYDQSRGQEAGALDSVAKPFETKTLAEKVEEAFSRASQPAPVAAAEPSPFNLNPTSSTPRVTSAMPAFSPVDLQSMLPSDNAAQPADPASLAPPFPPATPSPIGADDDDDEPTMLQTPGGFSLTPTPPPSAVGAKPPAPPALDFSSPAPPPLDFSSPPPAPSIDPLADPSDSRPRIQPPVIPTPDPSSDASATPVGNFFRSTPERNDTPAPPSFDAQDGAVESFSVEDSQPLEKTVPEQRAVPASDFGFAPKNEVSVTSMPLDDGPALAATPPPASAAAPSFALKPDRDFLARALEGTRSFRRAASAPSSPAEGAQTQYIQQLSKEIIEKIAWEVVPELAEIIIREALSKRQ